MKSDDRLPIRTMRAGVAIAEALFARDGRPPPPNRLAWVELELGDFLSKCGAGSRLMLSVMIWLVSLLAPAFVGRWALLASLPLPDRIHALAVLEKRFGDPLLAVKALLCLLYYEHPDAARDVGFDAKCRLPRVDAPRFTERA